MKFNIIDIITIIRMPKQRWQRQANYPIRAHTHTHTGHIIRICPIWATRKSLSTPSPLNVNFEQNHRLNCTKERKRKYKIFACEIIIFTFLILSTTMCGSGWCWLVGCLLQIIDLFLGSQKCRRTHQFLARSYDDAETYKRRHWLRQKIETRNRILNLKNNIS